jgi:cysteine sulfinate desulfinase/cysteine desulfurase-like protein/glyoxylase-like metal-dependent hydrolase (beta-lactamase superfamily II)/rhodanese-related sulfurtransferase
MRHREIYLDDNATTRVLPLAAQEAHDAMQELYGNPSSSHITGLRARHILESARAVAREVLGADTGRIVFTSGATEAIETGIFSGLCQIREDRTDDAGDGTAADSEPRLLLYGATEHKAVPQALQHWNRLLGVNNEIVAIPVDEFGQLDLEFLSEHIGRTDILCTMAVNNETGVIHDLDAIEQIVTAADHDVTWLVDSVQAIAKIDLHLANRPIDYATISGHKLYAPKGIGILYVRDGAPLTPLLAGGGQEGGARGGTENLPGVAAIAAVLQNLLQRETTVFSDIATLSGYRDRIVASLRKAFPDIVFNTPFDTSVPTTINFAVPGFTSKELLDLFDAAGVRVSSGSACGSALLGSYVLEAMGLPKWRSQGAIRMSFGPATTDADITAACARIKEVGQALSNACLVVSDSNSTHDVVLDGLVQLKMGSMCSWILADANSKRCVIIDPFEELLHRIETLVRCQEFQVIAVLDTHQHVDHDSPRELLVKVLGDFMASQADTDILGWPHAADGVVTLGDDSEAPFIRLYDDVVLAETPLPGHTVDGQLFLVGEPANGRLDPEHVRFAFAGDTLLIGGVGRTDFATSSAAAQLDSLRKLPKLIADHTVVCPTHDYSSGFVTTLGAERKHNPFLSKILDVVQVLSLEDYLAEKKLIDGEITDESNCELVCGRIQSFSDEGASSIDVKPDELKEYFDQHRQSTIVDVREPHEFHFAQDWHLLGFDAPPDNIPLTRFADFLSTILAQQDSDSIRQIIFLCRSGNRSAKAAEVVRRLGIPTAWHITGGIALGTRRSRHGTTEDEMEYVI